MIFTDGEPNGGVRQFEKELKRLVTKKSSDKTFKAGTPSGSFGEVSHGVLTGDFLNLRVAGWAACCLGRWESLVRTESVLTDPWFGCQVMCTTPSALSERGITCLMPLRDPPAKTNIEYHRVKQC